jgi:hypothetical protein
MVSKYNYKLQQSKFINHSKSKNKMLNLYNHLKWDSLITEKLFDFLLADRF